jgi:lipoate-protein ligase A
MLINVNLDALQNYLNPNKLKLLSKGISSVRARVENMANVNPQINHETLSEAIIKEFIAHYGAQDYVVKDFSEEDMKDIPKIKEIYDQTTSWEWLYQKSPDFTDEMETRFDWGIIDITVQVQGGMKI